MASSLRMVGFLEFGSENPDMNFDTIQILTTAVLTWSADKWQLWYVYAPDLITASAVAIAMIWTLRSH